MLETLKSSETLKPSGIKMGRIKDDDLTEKKRFFKLGAK